MEPLQIVIMGVCGSGKSTLATLLAQRLGSAFAEADDFHSEESISKMKAGLPLDDEDRWPWLRRLAAWMQERTLEDRSAVVSCSALKRSYRDVLRQGSPQAIFIHLDGARHLLLERLNGRQGHFMPQSLLDSQLAILEPFAPDERGARLEVHEPPQALVASVLRQVERFRC